MCGNCFKGSSPSHVTSLLKFEPKIVYKLNALDQLPESYPPGPVHQHTPYSHQVHPHKPHATQSSHHHTEPKDASIDFESVFENYGSSSPLKFRGDVIAECFKVANSDQNMAVQLVRRCFAKSERAKTGDQTATSGGKAWLPVALSDGLCVAIN